MDVGRRVLSSSVCEEVNLLRVVGLGWAREPIFLDEGGKVGGGVRTGEDCVGERYVCM